MSSHDPVSFRVLWCEFFTAGARKYGEPRGRCPQSMPRDVEDGSTAAEQVLAYLGAATEQLTMNTDSRATGSAQQQVQQAAGDGA